MRTRRILAVLLLLLLVPLPLFAEGQPESEAGWTVQVYGAKVQVATEKGKAQGEKMDVISFEDEGNVYVTAEIPKKKKLSYWVINGVRYDFSPVPKKFAVLKINGNLTIEAVCKNDTPVTLRSDEEIQAERTGERLVVEAVRAQLCHMKNSTKGGGGWIKESEFTEDYINRATKATETGGQITVKLKAGAMSGRKVIGWKFNDTQFRIGNVRTFIVRKLNQAMVYEPIFGKAASNPGSGATDPPNTIQLVVPPDSWYKPN